MKTRNNLKNFLFRLLLLVFIIVGNYWIYPIWSFKNPFRFLLIILITLLLFFADYLKKFKYLILIIPLVYIIFSFNYQKTIFNLSQEEIYYINQRRAYFPNQKIGKIYENKLSRFFYNYQRNFFEGLDINYYFFKTHPRERVGISEIKKFPFIFLPIFALGLCSLLKKSKLYFLYYFLFSLFLSSFFRPIDIYSFLFFPFIVLCIFNGILYLIENYHENKTK